MPTKQELQSLAVKAVVTFLQVSLSIIIAGNLFGAGTDTVSLLASAGAGGVGAVLSVIYNYLTALGTKLDPATELVKE